MSRTPPPGLLWIEGTEAGPGIASRLGITPSTYRKWRIAGKGPHAFVLGKRVVARVESVDAYIAELECRALLPSADRRPPEPRRPRRNVEGP